MPNLLTRLFKKRTPVIERAVLLSGSTPILTPFSGNAYANDIYRGAVDAIARNAAKLRGTHIIKTDTGRKDGDENTKRLLQVRSNPYTSAFDMLYRMTTHYYLYNNAFAYLQKNDKGDLIGIYPLRASNVEFMSDSGGELYAKFYFNSGNEYVLPYSDIVHLRRNYNDNDLFGDSNTAIIPALELAHAQNEGMISAIKSSATIRGVLKFTQVLAPEKLKEEKERFIQDYLQVNNSGGVIVTDSKMEYSDIKSEPYIIDEKQQQAVKDKIFAYLGISEKIVTSQYNEDEWAAFYESVIEPIAIQLSLEFTEKIFTQREQAFGNSILFEANRLQFASARTKTELIKELAPMKLLTRNQALEILNLPSVPDGDEYIQSLNYVNAKIADEYQLGGIKNERT